MLETTTRTSIIKAILNVHSGLTKYNQFFRKSFESIRTESDDTGMFIVVSLNPETKQKDIRNILISFRMFLAYELESIDDAQITYYFKSFCDKVLVFKVSNYRIDNEIGFDQINEMIEQVRMSRS